MMMIRIAPAEKKWIDQTVSNALETLKTNDSKARYDAVRTLRFLAYPESVEALCPFLTDGDSRVSFQAHFGIIGARDWTHARKTLYSAMARPSIGVNSHYIGALVHISIPHEDHIIPWDPNNPQIHQKRYDRLKKRKNKIEQQMLGHLATVYQDKTGRPMAETSLLLLSKKAGNELAKKNLAKTFVELTKNRKREALGHYWEKVKSSEFIPVLETILQSEFRPQQWRSRDVPSLALLRYSECEPQKARTIIIQDITQLNPRFSKQALTCLQDETLPDIEDTLVKNLVSHKGNIEKLSGLVERYATSRPLPQVRKFYLQHEYDWASQIQINLLRYWIKYDRSSALAALGRVVREKPRSTRLITEVLSDNYGPDAEILAISLLENQNPEIQIDIVRLLEKRGTNDCVAPLIERLTAIELDKNKKYRQYRTETGVHNQVIMALLRNKKWNLSETQKDTLRKQLQTERQRKLFAARFTEQKEAN
jgi:hypothetical protein